MQNATIDEAPIAKESLEILTKDAVKYSAE